MKWRSLIVPSGIARPYGRKTALALSEMVEDWSMDIPRRDFSKEEWQALDTAIRYLKRPEALDGSFGVLIGPQRPSAIAGSSQPTGRLSRRDVAEYLFGLQPLHRVTPGGVPLERVPCGGPADPLFRVWPHGLSFEPLLLNAWRASDRIISGLDELVVVPRKYGSSTALPPGWEPPDGSPPAGSCSLATVEAGCYAAISGPLTAEQIVGEIRATTTRIANWAAPQKASP